MCATDAFLKKRCTKLRLTGYFVITYITYLISIICSVDAAIIRSQRAMPSSTIESTSFQSTNDISRPTYTSTFPNNQFPSSHQDSTLSSGLTGRHFTLESLAAASLVNQVNDSSQRPAPMISGVHESHKLEQEQLQAPNKSQRQQKQRRPQKSQVCFTLLPV